MRLLPINTLLPILAPPSTRSAPVSPLASVESVVFVISMGLLLPNVLGPN